MAAESAEAGDGDDDDDDGELPARRKKKVTEEDTSAGAVGESGVICGRLVLRQVYRIQSEGRRGFGVPCSLGSLQ